MKRSLPAYHVFRVKPKLLLPVALQECHIHLHKVLGFQRSNNAAEDYGSVPLSRSTTARRTSTIPKQQITRSHEQFTWFGKDDYVHGEGKNFTMNLKTITDDCRE